MFDDRVFSLRVLQQPGCGCRVDDMMFRPPHHFGRIAISPAIVATLDREGDEDEIPLNQLRCTLLLLDRTGQEVLPSDLIVGSCIARPMVLPIPDSMSFSSCAFVFGDTAIRGGGVFRLRIQLVEWDDANARSVQVLTSIDTDAFPVVELAQFPIPGVEIRTELSELLYVHGADLYLPPREHEEDLNPSNLVTYDED